MNFKVDLPGYLWWVWGSSWLVSIKYVGSFSPYLSPSYATLLTSFSLLNRSFLIHVYIIIIIIIIIINRHTIRHPHSILHLDLTGSFLLTQEAKVECIYSIVTAIIIERSK